MTCSYNKDVLKYSNRFSKAQVILDIKKGTFLDTKKGFNEFKDVSLDV